MRLEISPRIDKKCNLWSFVPDEQYKPDWEYFQKIGVPRPYHWVVIFVGTKEECEQQVSNVYSTNNKKSVKRVQKNHQKAAA